MNRTRWSARYCLAILACSVGLGLGSVAHATTSAILASGVYSYNYTGSNVILTVDRLDNITVPPRISGELYLEFWAFPFPFTGLSQSGYQQIGFKMASYSLGRLAPGYYFTGVNSGPVAFTNPPPGVWFYTSLITEYDASDINNGGFLPAAFHNFPGAVTIAPPAATVAPQPGLWWDPTRPGEGYTIHVNNGSAVVVTYTSRADGTSQWYLSFGSMTNNGQTFTSTLDKYVGGPCIPCVDVRFPTPAGNDGTITINFTSSTSATVLLPGGRVAHIVPAVAPN